MKISQSVAIGAWFIIGLNLLMGFGSIWIFMRMAPAIEVIIDRNVVSLQACEEMQSALTMISEDKLNNSKLKQNFINALHRAENNITEQEEPAACELIHTYFLSAFEGNIMAREKTNSAIILLGKINRQAMIKADRRAQQFGYAGAWGVVFMSICVFIAGMTFKRKISKHIVNPLKEIHLVILAHKHGDHMRRCTGSDLSKDVRGIFNNMNEFFDQIHSKDLVL